MLSKLSLESKKFLQRNNLPYQRYFVKHDKIKHRLTIITGQRGIKNDHIQIIASGSSALEDK
jgi:hypothetical protein